ncbi:hypothetical protein F5Y03DRAFT_401689 [Xylaria venustula]|nr:hypothetical protein F5Y03DRAFT_401689 [Xylaria venustula]
MVRNSGILILDEATSSVDTKTEAIMQDVIAVMHRLTHIIRYDKAALLEDGHLMEFDAPQTLLHNSNSRFSRIIGQVARLY